MAKKKQDLIDEAKALGLDVDSKSKLAEIGEAIEVAKAGLSDSEVEEKLTEAKEEKTKAKQKESPPNEAEPLVEQPEDEQEPEADKPAAKAGKRSAKAAKEADAKEAKEARKAAKVTDAEGETPKKPVPKARSRLERRGKKYREAAKLIDQTKEYSLEGALELAQKTSITKFDASVELHFNLGVDPKLADQNIRGTVNLPSGSGNTLRVAVFGGSDDDAKAAKTAGADIAGGDDFLEQLKKEKLDFDVLIATPDTMSKLGAFAKLLGPKGLMPNPKSGTVTKDVATAVKEAKSGKVEFRVDKQSIIHVAIGKVSFKPDALLANATTLLKAIQDARPASVKGIYIQKVTVTTTMGPSVRLDLKSL